MKTLPLFLLPLAAVIGMWLLTQSEIADADDGVSAEVAKRISAAIKGIEVENVQKAPMPGWYQISSGSAYGYITEDGRYLIEGDLIDLETDTNISEQQRQKDRKALMAELDKSEMITFAPENPKHWVVVFTDVDCGYCRQLHRQISDYNEQGIGIRYLFFPTAGPGSKAFKRAESVWCSDDPAAAMTAAKAGQELPEGKCKTPIQQQYRIAMQAGARGTPAIVTESGRLIGGYKPPAMLLRDLESRP